ncbi:hypothetical protein MKX01_022672 [Papaver californicum]|nr:hypothetical protein MKX01_022672 [Papaver californicum]
MLLLWHHNRNIQFFPQGLMQIRYIYFLRSINLLTEMKSGFGTNDCSLLCINSGQDGSGDQQDRPWFPYETDSPLAFNSEDINENRNGLLVCYFPAPIRFQLHLEGMPVILSVLNKIKGRGLGVYKIYIS